MRMLPSTANAMTRSAIQGLVSSAVPTSNATYSFAVLLYTGAIPTKAELEAFYNGPTQLTGANARYLNSYPMLNARTADYVGGIGGIKPLVDQTAKNVTVSAAAAMAYKSVAGNTDNRSCLFTKDATPTWFMLVGGLHNTYNFATGLVSTNGGSADTTLYIGTVGDENSNADLKILGGKVFSNSATPTDQSKAVIINDLVIKFA